MLVGHASAQEATIVTLGDSNTSGFGVGAQEAFPARLEAMLRKRGRAVHVVNAGVPGDTFGGMLGRVDSSVPQGTRLAIVRGGYNDSGQWGFGPIKPLPSLRVLMRTSDQSCAALTDAEVSCVDVGHMIRRCSQNAPS